MFRCNGVGRDAARNVSQLVLVNNDFASMPDVVAEGRRTINNLERSSSLYMVKTIYSVILSIFFIFFHMQYPFEPIQLTLIGAFTVGIPSFVLALQPNKNIIKGNFTFNIIARALPAVICVVSNIITAAIVCKFIALPTAEFSTICVYTTAISCMLLVIRLSLPVNALRAAMLAVCTAGILVGSIFFGHFFSLVSLSFEGLVLLAILIVATIVIFNIFYNIAQKLIQKYKSRG